ncbi:MAG: hypothetical protein J6E48_01490 [Prevotella sp.]|nr:hypothetical protein [Prevotella sp.]
MDHLEPTPIFPERAAVLYTLALSAKTNHINLFDYIVDILDKTAIDVTLLSLDTPTGTSP